MPAGRYKNAAPLGARSAGQSASLNPPAHHFPLLIVTRMGWDYRPGPRQRIERVARRVAALIKGHLREWTNATEESDDFSDVRNVWRMDEQPPLRLLACVRR